MRSLLGLSDYKSHKQIVIAVYVLIVLLVSAPMSYLKRKKKKEKTQQIPVQLCLCLSSLNKGSDVIYNTFLCTWNEGIHKMSDNTPHNVFCFYYTISTHTNNIAPHLLLWPRFVISFMPHLSSESMHKLDEYVPLYSEGRNHVVMQLSSIAPSNSIRSLFNNNLMSNVWGRVLSVSIVPYTRKKTQIHTHNPIGGCTIGFLPCRINWNHIFGWELSIRLVQRSEEDISEAGEKRMIKREGGWMRDMGTVWNWIKEEM